MKEKLVFFFFFFSTLFDAVHTATYTQLRTILEQSGNILVKDFDVDNHFRELSNIIYSTLRYFDFIAYRN